MALLLKLYLAHFLGDFLLQPSKWVDAKEKRRVRAYQLYLHSLLHGILIMVLVWDWYFGPWALILAAAHLFIDTLKLIFQRPRTRRLFFFMDQFAHLLITYIVWMVYSQNSFDVAFMNDPKFLLMIVALYVLTQPTSIFVKIFISRWTPKTYQDESISLQRAGMYIGFLERLLVFIFILTQHWEAIGFLITAKSVFRYGDLKESKDTRLTEYILIGTLLSFGIAIVVGIGYLYLTTLL